ncbi:hypothetical protein B7P33_06270 [Sediminicola luteus]|uniref:Methane oxygenase PmoA n=2 Tax=Sediminicola luteus TaxID=319238 RepID=A0A2A4G9F1_9FLAO|nr:hypothetical protein B7P33_06270 [Sediminicola luteus]
MANVSTEKTGQERVVLTDNPAEKRVDVHIDGKLFTAYVYPDNIKKPVLYPLVTPKGTKITRKFPLEKSVGERVDHPHHVGVWFNYGDVNGLDFWNNSDSIKVEKRHKYGTIRHNQVISTSNGEDSGSLKVSMDWKAPDGTVLLVENTEFVFGADANGYYIDRITSLTAQDQNVDFKDNKEGVLGIRVTRALEHPSDKPSVFTDANGIPTKVEALDNSTVKGNYLNAQGVEGTDVWGKRSNWVNLRSEIEGEPISLVVLDHKDNVGYPTYWHARGYGLFAANPLGQHEFSKGKERLDFFLEAGKTTTFKHRIIVANKALGKTEIDAEFDAFGKK